MPRAFYDPSNVSVTLEYKVAATGDQFFIPGNNQAYGDNPDAGTMAQRRTCNTKVIGSTATEALGLTPDITYVSNATEQ